MATILNLEYDLELPTIKSFEDFRHWSHSDTFPESGRIDYLLGRIEVDLSPEDLFTHGAVKSEIHGVLHGIIRAERLGRVFVDSTRIASLEAELSAEPDIVFISQDSIASQAIQLTPKASGEEGRYIEIEGGPDLIVEVVSDSSKKKDTERLPVAYFAAGVKEYWLVDVRGKQVDFHIYRRGESSFEEIPADKSGGCHSTVFNRGFRLERFLNEQDGFWDYRLVIDTK